MDLTNNITEYLRYCSEQRTLNSKTTKAYRTDLLQFAEFSSGMFSKDIIISYIGCLHRQFKPKTARRKIASLKAFAHYLMIQEIINANPFDKIDCPSILLCGSLEKLDSPISKVWPRGTFT